MKKIINGKSYDTETATLLAEHSEKGKPHLAENFTEKLYIKRTGEYFLHGEGGRDSKYGQRYGHSGMYNPDGSGEKITLLTVKDAKQWAEGYISGEEYERIFGDVEEPDDTEQQQQFSILLPLAILENLKQKKNDTGATISSLIVKALRDAGY